MIIYFLNGKFKNFQFLDSKLMLYFVTWLWKSKVNNNRKHKRYIMYNDGLGETQTDMDYLFDIFHKQPRYYSSWI